MMNGMQLNGTESTLGLSDSIFTNRCIGYDFTSKQKKRLNFFPCRIPSFLTPARKHKLRDFDSKPKKNLSKERVFVEEGRKIRFRLSIYHNRRSSFFIYPCSAVGYFR